MKRITKWEEEEKKNEYQTKITASIAILSVILHSVCTEKGRMAISADDNDVDFVIINAGSR